jgi:hypothetical protein
MTAGVGRDLRFRVTVAGFLSPTSTDAFNYPGELSLCFAFLWPREITSLNVCLWLLLACV